MGANRKQGWYLFAFLLGFVLVPAGIVAYIEANATFWGALAVAAGAVLIVAAAFGFAVIKRLEHQEEGGPSRPPASDTQAQALVQEGTGL